MKTDLQALTGDALLAMIGGRGVRAEILRRVEALGNKVNLLAFRYFWPRDAADRDDAWAGLLACCWRAGGNLLIPRRMDGRETTEQVISESLAQRLAAYEKSGKRTIAQIALDGGFRWIARLVRNDLADYMRALFRGQRPRGRPSIPRAPQPDSRAFLETLLRVQRARFVAALGEKLYGALIELARRMPLGGNRRAWKRKATRLMAERGISERQARTEKKRMLCLSDGEPVIEEAVREILTGTSVSRNNPTNRV